MKTIAIVAGGDSSEYEVSLRSAAEVSNILSESYNVYIIMMRGTNWFWEDQKGMYHNIDKNDFTLKVDDEKIRFDGVFVAIHGTPGEDGLLQGYFDMMNIPYTSCNAFSSALTFNKHACKLFLRNYNIAMAESIILKRDDEPDVEDIIRQMGLPCFVKPNDSGSSFGVTKVKQKEELISAIDTAFKESNTVMIEKFLDGREVACGVVKTKDRTIVMPVTEIISKNEFFDYEAKYTPGKSDEVTPADMPGSVCEEIQKLSLKIYELLGCSGIVRVDFIVIIGKPFFLEINTVPGMTQESIIPKQAAVYGIPLEELFSMVVEEMFI